MFLRPFVAGAPAPIPVPTPVVDDDPDDAVRPYFVTGGRTRASVDLQFETMVVATARGKSAARRLGFERAEILGVAEEPISIAEISANLRIPLTVALVLVGDLVTASHLSMSQTNLAPADDIALIKRLIHGVRSL
jgi:Protein of unknown function (DUF742)